MLDSPDARAILGEVQAALKAGIALGFQQAVAANAVALALREQQEADAAQETEHSRLAALLGCGGTLAQLNHALAAGIADASLDIAREDLTGHLIATTIAKMKVDQPNYPSFRAWRENK